MPLLKTLDDNVFSGEGALQHLDTLLRNYKNVILFADDNVLKAGNTAGRVMNHTSKHKLDSLTLATYSGKALPIEDIEQQYRKIKASEQKTDAVIALGGGTVIDLAKIIAIALSNDCNHAEEVLDNKTLSNTIPLIFIPTTAGTGSEATSFAVVYRNKIKISIDSKSILPTHVILDPTLLLTLPEHVLNATVLDALAQATESVWAVGSTEESKKYSCLAIPLILDNIQKPNSIQRLNALQEASFWAGKAINISKTTLPHSISYPITAHHGVPHGIAVFLTLPEVAHLNFHTDNSTKQEKTTLGKINESFSLLFKLYNTADINELTTKLNDIMDTLKINKRLNAHNIPADALPALAEKGITKGRSDNNPRNVSPTEILQILQKIY